MARVDGIEWISPGALTVSCLQKFLSKRLVPVHKKGGDRSSVRVDRGRSRYVRLDMRWRVSCLDEHIRLQVRRLRISLYDGGKRRVRDHSSCLGIKPLIQPEKAISCPQGLELVRYDRLESWTDNCAAGVRLR